MKMNSRIKSSLLYGFLIFLFLEFAKVTVFKANHYMSKPQDMDKAPYSAKKEKRQIVQSKNELKEGFPIFCLIMCEPTEGDLKKVKKMSEMANKPKRQLNQAINVIKSAVSLTNLTYINFIIVVDEYWIYEELLEEISKWPKDIREKLVFQRRGVWYPDTGRDFRALFRVCATARIFLPDHFTDVDALIYLDTDVLFMRPPEELWNHFKYFGPRHVSGIAPCLYRYNNRRFKHLHYGESGLNVGVWMMNLTRMRDFPGGWINEFVHTFDRHRKRLGLPTQDLTNIVFSKHPEMLYEVGCEWNYRFRLCSKGYSLPCEITDKGVHLLHGVDLSFFLKRDSKFVKFYEAWDSYEVGSPLTEFLAALRRRLAEVDQRNLKSSCKKHENIDQILTKALENYIRTL